MTEAIRTEQIRILFQNLPLTIAGSASVGFAVTFVLYPSVSPVPLLGWLAVSICMWLWRLRDYWRSRDTVLTPALARRMGRHTIVYSACFGVLWGWLPVYYFGPDNFLVISHIALFMVGMVAGALVTQSVFLPSLYAFLIPISLASTFALMTKAGPYAYLALFSTAYCVIGVAFGHRAHAMFLEVIHTRFENDDLVVALRREKHQVEEASKAKSQFLAAASHDVRQPLHAMSLYVGMLKEDPGNTAIVRRVDETLSGLEELYSRILEISQLDAGAVEVESGPVDLTRVCDRCIEQYQALANAADLRLTGDYEGGIWVHSDSTLLRRILDNLVSNALRYTPHGEVVITIRRCAKQVILEVRDTGIGISADRQQDIFREYYQVGNRQRDRAKGLGLGLSIVKRLCELLGHEIELASQLGVGTVFGLTLDASDAAAPTTSPPVSSFSLEGARVLVVEDDPQVRDALLMQLDRWGCEPQWHADASNIDSIAQRPDVIIADYRLPGDTDGVGVVKRVRHQFRHHIPGIVVTGDTAPQVLQRLKTSGLSVLHKPVSADTLKAEMNAVLLTDLASGHL